MIKGLTSKPKTRSLLSPNSPNLLHKFVLFSLGASALNIVLTFGMFGALQGVASKQQPPYVLDAAGNRYPVRLSKAGETVPSELQGFVSGTLYELFDWRGKIPGGKGKPDQVDPGVKIKTARGDKAIATTAWAAGFKLSDPFRSEFLKTLAALTPQDIFGGKGDQGFFVLELIDAPEKIKDGWRVRIQGKLMLFTQGDNVGTAIALKYDVFVREWRGYNPNSRDAANAIATGSEQIEKTKHLGLSDLQRIVYENSERYTIYAMREF